MTVVNGEVYLPGDAIPDPPPGWTRIKFAVTWGGDGEPPVIRRKPLPPQDTDNG